MATSFLTSLPKACFSSALEDVRVTTDADFVVCTVRDSAGALVIQLKSYPYNGEAVFTDLKSVISQWLLSNDLLMQRFEIRVGEDWDEQRAECVASVLVGYCAYGVSSVSSNNKEGTGDAAKSLFDAVVKQRFLSTLGSKVIYPEVEESLSWIALPKAETALKIEGFVEGADGKPLAVFTEINSQATSDDYASCTYAISLEDMAERLGGRPLAFTCTVGSRVCAFYAAREPLPQSKEQPTCVFRFRNAFNAVETAAFVGVTTAKQEVEREEAVSGGVTSFYDEHTAQSYEVESAALDADFAAWLAQLLASPDVRLWQKGKAWDDLPHILITESTYEVSDSDADQRTVKFTWRYADDIPQLPAILLPSDGVFTDTYNPLFS